MPSYSEIYNQIYSDADFERRTVIACLVAADTIIQEDPQTADHEVKLNWARAVISNPLQAARKMMPALIVNPIVQAGSVTDSDLLWLVTSNVVAYSPTM